MTGSTLPKVIGSSLLGYFEKTTHLDGGDRQVINQNKLKIAFKILKREKV